MGMDGVIVLSLSDSNLDSQIRRYLRPMNDANSGSKSSRDNQVLIYLALLAVMIHLLFNRGYGYFHDEFYAIACSKHLAWGYVDQPPFSEFVLAVSGRLLGYSLFALRLLPAICGGLEAFLVGLIARKLGGALYAEALAVTAFIIGGVYLAIDGYFSMNCFDHLFWVMAAYLLVLILSGGDTRLWVLLGVVAGLGLENKYSVGFFGVGLIVGLALTPARRHFCDKWLWVGGALAAFIFLPHVLWEIHHHFPSAEFIRNATLKKNLPMTPWEFLGQCVLLVHPFAAPVWLAGLVYLFFTEAGRKFRALGWIFLAVLAILLSTHSKPYYFAPAFLLLLPAGGVAIEAFLDRRGWKWPKAAYLGALILGGAITAPLVLPILPVESLIRYQDALGIRVSSGERGHSSSKLPQIFSGRFGWPEMVAQIAEIYSHLSSQEKADCVIGASNYGEAGAIDFLGPRYGLPNAISSHNNYWYWGSICECGCDQQLALARSSEA